MSGTIPVDGNFTEEVQCGLWWVGLCSGGASVVCVPVETNRCLVGLCVVFEIRVGVACVTGKKSLPSKVVVGVLVLECWPPLRNAGVLIVAWGLKGKAVARSGVGHTIVS